MYYILTLSFLYIPLLSYASEDIEIELYKNSNPASLDIYQKNHLYRNTKEYFKTCIDYERVTGKTYTQQKAKERLNEIKSGDYLKIAFAEGSTELSIAHEKKKIEEMYIAIDDRGFPDLVSINKGQIQLYSKCSGSVALEKFACDKLVSKLFGFKLNKDLCEMLKTKQLTGN